MSRPRLATALATGALCMGLSYVLQRLWDASSEPPMTAVRKMAMIPYYWRVGAALLHGAVAASACWVLAPQPGERALQRLTRCGALLALVGGLAMLVVP